jgi:RNA polymerase sigma-70 factor (ECF subfamily)
VNRNPTTGVWLNEAVMDALAASFPGSALSRDESLTREFEERLADCPKLAYCVALGVLHNTAEAEDVAQEAMLRAYRSFHRLRDRERFRGWLVRMAFRLALDRIRSKNRRERHETTAMRVAEESQRGASIENLVASREFERQVARALDALPEKLRIVMVLAAIEGYNTREVAKLAGVPEGTVKSRLFLARKKLAESLQCLVKNTPVG